MDFSPPPDPVCLLVDNGSLQPAPTLALRRIAAALSQRIGRPVAPVSLLHSDKVPVAALEGVAAEVFEGALRARYDKGTRRFLVVPLFFGPSGALTTYIPDRVAALAQTMPGLQVVVVPPLAGSQATPDRRIAHIVADGVRGVMVDARLSRPVVVMVDHGSPQRAVAAVRNQIALQLAGELGASARAVVAASMERREGPEFDFTEPLLVHALAMPPCGDGAGDVVVAPLFFSPGRHAGPGGDIEKIARWAEARCAGLRVYLAPLVGEHPALIDMLADRYAEAAQA